MSQRGLQGGIGLSLGGGKSGARRFSELMEGLEKKGINIRGLSARQLSDLFIPPHGGNPQTDTRLRSSQTPARLSSTLINRGSSVDPASIWRVKPQSYSMDLRQSALLRLLMRLQAINIPVRKMPCPRSLKLSSRRSFSHMCARSLQSSIRKSFGCGVWITQKIWLNDRNILGLSLMILCTNDWRQEFLTN